MIAVVDFNASPLGIYRRFMSTIMLFWLAKSIRFYKLTRHLFTLVNSTLIGESGVILIL